LFGAPGMARSALTGAVPVAVGMLITQHPPHRSQRALLTHWAPPSGSGVKTMQRLWMQDTDFRKEEVTDRSEA